MPTEINANNTRIAKNTIMLYLRMFFVLAVSLYTTRVVLRVLGQEDYGLNNVVCGFVSMFAFLSTSMSNSIQRFYNYELGKHNEGRIGDVYTVGMLTQFIILLIILLTTETFGLWYVNNKMVLDPQRIWVANWIFQFSVFSFVFVVMQVPFTAAIMAYEKMDFFAFVSVLAVVLKLVFVVILQFIGGIDKLLLYGSFLLITDFVSFGIYAIYAKRRFKELKIKRDYDKSLIKPILSFSWWNLFGSFAYTIKGQGLNVLLNAFFGTVINAARGVSSQILSALQGFASNVFVAFRPQLVQSYASGDYQRTTSLMFTMSKVTFYLFFMLSLPISLEINYILKLWLGDNVPEYTAIFSILVLVNALISNFNTPVSLVIHATGKMRNYQVATSIVIVSILPVSWFFLQLGASPVSVYWVSIALVIINQAVCLLLLKRVFTYSVLHYVREVILPCLSVVLVSSIAPCFAHLTISQGFVRLVVVAVLSIVLTSLSAYFMGLTTAQKLMVNKHVKRILSREK